MLDGAVLMARSLLTRSMTLGAYVFQLEKISVAKIVTTNTNDNVTTIILSLNRSIE